MKTEFLKGLGIEDDVISKIMAENGKDIEKEKAKTADLNGKLEQANAKISEYETKISELETAGGNAEKYKKDLEALQQKIQEEKAAAEKKAKEEAVEADFKNRFDSLVGENKWRDELTGNAVYAEFKKAAADEANKGKGDKEIFEMLTKDKNYYESPNQLGNMGGIGNVGSSTITDDEARRIMGLAPIK